MHRELISDYGTHLWKMRIFLVGAALSTEGGGKF